MKLSQSFFNENLSYVTPSEIIEFLYCKRFIYYMKCLGISQNEEKRYKVQKGREIHEKKERENKDYLRKKLGAVHKEINVQLISEKYRIKGIVDEILTLEDGTMSPLDYKFAVYDERIFQTYLTQIVLYSLMIEEQFDKKVEKGYLVYCRNGNTVKEIEITEKEKNKVTDILIEYTEVINGIFPKATTSKARCIDCCYRNVCIK